MKPYHLLISAGEVSGDLQGSLLIKALRQEAAARDWLLRISALGGTRMAAAGATLLADTSSIGAIGLLESLPYVRSTLAIHRKVRADLKAVPPDLTVLIDYPGANLPLAKSLKRTYPDAPVLYYIAPQEWAWAFSQSTTKAIVACTDQILAIFSQEAEYYAARGGAATWVGHPFVDALAHGPSRADAREKLQISAEQTAVALLPASRRQELQQILPVLAIAAQQIQHQYPAVHYWIPVAQDSFRQPILDAVMQHGLRATLTTDALLTLRAADLIIGKSGTANLEAALLQIPQIVVYRVHPFSGWLYRKLLRFKVPFISPVNLVAQREIVPELLQELATPERIVEQAQTLLGSSTRRAQMREDYQRLNLGQPGVLQRTARIILDALPMDR